MAPALGVWGESCGVEPLWVGRVGTQTEVFVTVATFGEPEAAYYDPIHLYLR